MQYELEERSNVLRIIAEGFVDVHAPTILSGFSEAGEGKDKNPCLVSGQLLRSSKATAPVRRRSFAVGDSSLAGALRGAAKFENSLSTLSFCASEDGAKLIAVTAALPRRRG
jgi:hypothetical protein